MPSACLRHIAYRPHWLLDFRLAVSLYLIICLRASFGISPCPSSACACLTLRFLILCTDCLVPKAPLEVRDTLCRYATLGYDYLDSICRPCASRGDFDILSAATGRCWLPTKPRQRRSRERLETTRLFLAASCASAPPAADAISLTGLDGSIRIRPLIRETGDSRRLAQH